VSSAGTRPEDLHHSVTLSPPSLWRTKHPSVRGIYPSPGAAASPRMTKAQGPARGRARAVRCASIKFRSSVSARAECIGKKNAQNAQFPLHLCGNMSCVAGSGMEDQTPNAEDTTTRRESPAADLGPPCRPVPHQPGDQSSGSACSRLSPLQYALTKKCACKSFAIRTYKNKRLKPSWNVQLQKNPGGWARTAPTSRLELG
jgi:hypothetical protein